MEIDTNKISSHFDIFEHKTPLDLRIIVYILYVIGFFQLAVSGLLITPFARLGESERHILFGAITLSTKFPWIIYMSIFGISRLLCAQGLMRRLKLAWWATLIINLYELSDMFFSFPKNKLNALVFVGTFINLSIIVWLFLRMKLFKKKLLELVIKVSAK